jgi:hypothetical protein
MSEGIEYTYDPATQTGVPPAVVPVWNPRVHFDAKPSNCKLETNYILVKASDRRKLIIDISLSEKGGDKSFHNSSSQSKLDPSNNLSKYSANYD